MAGQVISPLSRLKVRPAHRFRELKITRASSSQCGHMATATEEGAEVVAVGSNVETFGAVDSKADRGKGDFENLELIDANASWGSIDRLSFAGQFVKGNAVFLDGGNHGRNLVELPRELLEGSFDGGLIERGDRAGFEDFSRGVLGVGGFA